MSTRSVVADRWRTIIQRQQASRLSVAAFCRRAGVPQASFYAWRQKLRNGVGFAEVRLAREGRWPTGKSVMSGQSAAESVAEAGGIELRVPGRRSIVVQRGFDRQTLLELLAALEASSSDMTAREVVA